MTWSTSDVAVCCSSASAEISRALAQLVQQAGVLDRDNGLIGKSRHQLNLFRGEWLRCCLRHKDYPDDISVAQEGGAKRSAIAADLLCPGPAIFRVRQHIGHMNHSGVHRGPSRDAAPVHRNLERFEIISELRVHLGCMAEACNPAEKFALALE